jgi:hypothetical protein
VYWEASGQSHAAEQQREADLIVIATAFEDGEPAFGGVGEITE